MRPSAIRIATLTCILGGAAAVLPSCRPAGEGTVHVERTSMSRYAVVPDRLEPGPSRDARTRPAASKSGKNRR